MMKMTDQQLDGRDGIPGLAEKAAYGLGDLASSVVLVLAGSYLLVFYTTAGGLGVGAASLILLIARLVNIIADPLIGSAIDAQTSRNGVPAFLKWGAIPLGLLTTLSFVQPFADPQAKFAWCLGTFILFNIVYSVVNTPYGAMGLLITRDLRGRFDLNRFRFVGSNVGIIAVGALVSPALAYFGGSAAPRGFAIVAAIAGTLAAGLIFLTYAGCRIRLDPAPRHVPVLRAVKHLTRTPRWLVVTGVMACSNAAIGSIFGLIPFVVPFVYHASALRVALVFTILNAAAIVGTAGAGLVSGSRGPEFGLAITFLGQIAALAALWLHPVLDPFSIAAFAVLGVSMGASYPTSYTALASAIGAADSGERHSLTGIGYALCSAITKLALGVGGVVAGAALYVSDQPLTGPSPHLALLAGMTLAPALMCAAATGMLGAARGLFK